MSKKKKSTKPRKPKKKNIWLIEGLEARCKELIEGGILNEEKGLAKLCDQLNEQFTIVLSEASLKVTQKAVVARYDKLIWTARVDNDFWKAIQNGLEDKWREIYSWIPKKIADRRKRSRKGSTRAKSVSQFKAGMGRLSTSDMPKNAGYYEFPDISYQKPLVLSEDKEGQALLINGALVGIKYPDIESNTMRRALADARKRNAKAVILTNVTELWTKKTAGPLAAYRAKVSGLQINSERFPEDYRQEVQDILDGKISDQLVYQTLNEKFNEIMDALHKITHRPNGKGPTFSGPVYIPLGLKEEELIYAAAYYECRYMTIVQQNRIKVELKMARNQLVFALKMDDQEQIDRWEAEISRLENKEARTIISNIADKHYEFYRRRMRAYVVKRFEETIPNSMVVSQGDTYLRAHKHIIKIHIPGRANITEGQLAKLGDSYGFDVFHDTLADMTISCHPYSLNHRYVGREDSKDGLPVTKFMHTAPSALNMQFLREEFKDSTKKSHPLHNLIFNPQVKPGVLWITWANEMINADTLPIEKLNDLHQVRDVTNFVFPYPKTQYVTAKLATDLHFGGTAKRYIWDPKERIHYGVDEAANELMRRLGVMNSSNLGIHMYAEMDDGVNGCLWFNPHWRPDPKEMSIIDIERWLQQMTSDIQRAAEKGNNEEVVRLTDEINRISIAQLYFKGEHFPFNQMMQVYDRHLDPQIDFYDSVLQRFVKSGIKITGISKINRIMSDHRDLGVLNFPNGNHIVNTTKGANLEGEFYARHLQARLGQLPFWRGKDEFLREAVRAPRFSHTTFGWGTMQAPGGYPWGVRVHGSPARQSGWSDILGAVVKSDLARGDDSYGLLKNVTITFFGDKHFYAKAETERMIYIMCAAGVHTDTYGSVGGFPPNNTGVCFVSWPVDGPEAGPIIVRMLSHDYLRDWFLNPWEIDWKKIVPNPV